MSDKHEQARDLGEQALDAMDQGDEAKADALIEKAKQIDKTALEELVQDLDEGAGKTPPE
jgi:phage shock protein A